MKVKFWNDYYLDPNFDKIRVKEIEVDLNNRKQVFDIIKKRGQYKTWQPDRIQKKKLIRILEKLDS